MLSTKDALRAFKEMGISEEDANEIVKLFKPQIKFHKYLIDTLKIDSEDVERLTKENSNLYVSSKIEEFKNNGGDINNVDESWYFNLAGESTENLALQHGYDEKLANKLKTNIIKIQKTIISKISKIS